MSRQKSQGPVLYPYCTLDRQTTDGWQAASDWGDKTDQHPLQEKLENSEQKLDGLLYKAQAHTHPVELVVVVNPGNLLLRVLF
jgi:hypothetical protein